MFHVFINIVILWVRRYIDSVDPTRISYTETQTLSTIDSKPSSLGWRVYIVWNKSVKNIITERTPQKKKKVSYIFYFMAALNTYITTELSLPVK